MIDDQVGHLVAVLKQRGMAENTFIFFASDHGLFTKSVAYDPSMRVPLLCSGPGIEAGDEAELYDMAADPQERDNLAGEEREVVRQMAQRLQARWLEGQGRR